MTEPKIVYRYDEIVAIFGSCLNLKELDKAANALGYLIRINDQTASPIYSKLYKVKYKELIKTKL